MNYSLPCRWDGNNMIILEAYVIASPDYIVVTPLPDQATDISALKRLEKMVSYSSNLQR
jgi:hypothetical protein